MGWHRYWKTWKGGSRSYTYRHWAEQEDAQIIKEDAQDWAFKEDGGVSAFYSVGHDPIDSPPVEWLREESARALNRIIYYTQQSTFIPVALAKATAATEEEEEPAKATATEEKTSRTCFNCEHVVLEQATVMLHDDVAGRRFDLPVSATRCPECGIELVGTSDLKAFEMHIARDLALDPPQDGPQTSEAFTYMRKTLGIPATQAPDHDSLKKMVLAAAEAMDADDEE